MNLGIGDAVELAKQIVENDLAGYSSLRHKEGTKAIKITERGRKMATGVSWQRRTAFRALLASANAMESIRKQLGRFLVEF